MTPRGTSSGSRRAAEGSNESNGRSRCRCGPGALAGESLGERLTGETPVTRDGRNGGNGGNDNGPSRGREGHNGND